MDRQASPSRDFAAAYLAAAMKVASWLLVSALIFRYLGPAAFAMFALVRATIGLLNYTSLGLGPAVVHYLALAQHRGPLPVMSLDAPVLNYEAPPALSDPVRSLYSNALAAAHLSGFVGLAITIAYAVNFDSLHRVPGELAAAMPAMVLFMGIGIVLRLVSDGPAAVLQVRGAIAVDNVLLAGAEVVWAALSCAAILLPRGQAVGTQLDLVAVAFAISGAFLLGARAILAGRETGVGLFGWRSHMVNAATLGKLLAFGLPVLLAQLADFLYSPTDYIIINRLLDPLTLATYAPAVQIDSGLLLIVAAIGAVLLPRSAIAHAAGDRATLRRYYLRGTAAGFSLIAAAALLVWLTCPWVFFLWLHDRMPATQIILPLVLVHTVIGGASIVGRSVLLAMGKVKPFTISVLVAGAANVLLSFSFVRFFGWGLWGIILGTIIAVVGRCVLWMPWYVMRTLGEKPRPSPA